MDIWHISNILAFENRNFFFHSTLMSTTRFWGEPDDGDKVRHANGGPSMKWV